MNINSPPISLVIVSCMQNYLSITETSAAEPNSPCNSPEAPPYSPILRSTPLASVAVETSPATPQEEPGDYLEEHVQVTQEADHGGQENEPSCCSSNWCDFKIVGDNIDKNVHPRHESLDHHTRSLHYFNCYAVKDRVDLGSLSDLKPLVDISQVDLTQLLPQKEDLDGIVRNMTILAARTLTTHVEQFNEFKNLVPEHIPHQYSHQMRQKSTVVRYILIDRAAQHTS